MVSGDLAISLAEHKSRIEKIRVQLKKSRCAALYLTNPTRILYTTGFSHISTERPLALVIPQEGAIFMMGPHLEEDHAKQNCLLIEEFSSYLDYPGKTHPIRHFASVLTRKGFAGSKIATDSVDGAAGGWGYRGPSLRDLLHQTKMVDGKDLVDDLRSVKSRQEILLLKESSRWAEKAHDILMENIAPGEHDALIGLKASYQTLTEMMKKLGARYRQLKWGLSPVVVGCRGQVGPGSAVPHAVFSKRRIRRGDVLVTEAGVEVGGYTCELERTMIVGKPRPREKKYFETMLRVQDAALGAFLPGVACSQVDAIARETVEAAGLAGALLLHLGHGIGIAGHAPPRPDPSE